MAARILSLSAPLNFDDIFLELFGPDIGLTARLHDGVTGSGGRWWSFMAYGETFDRCRIESAFAILHTYSLVQSRRSQTAYTMHKLVHA